MSKVGIKKCIDKNKNITYEIKKVITDRKTEYVPEFLEPCCDEFAEKISWGVLGVCSFGNIPSLFISHDWGYSDLEYFPINNCPFCGEKINIYVVEE